MLRPAGGEWAEAGVNGPVAQGMSVRTTANGRAALRIGGEIVSLAATSEIEIVRLDGGATQIVLHQGRTGVLIAPEAGARSVEIDLAKGGVWLLAPGDYDIAVGDGQGPARIAVFDGHARFAGSGVDSTIAAGSATVLSGRDPVLAGVDIAAADDFVAWCRPSRSDEAPPALRHLSAEVTGYEALDNNGFWAAVDGHDAVWFPREVGDDWAPYRYGHWRWIAPWGWNWIDDMAWGFAPSHYGRWVRIAEADPLDPSTPGTARWGWVPGRLGAEAAYSPALVAFLGTAGVGLSYADAVGPAVGWFPLAPGEPYWPSYTKEPAVIARLNADLGDWATLADAAGGEPPDAVVNGQYQNRRFASVVPRSVFLAGQPVAASLLQLPERRLENAPLLAGSPLLSPAAPRQASPPMRLAREVRSLARIVTRRIDKTVARATLLARATHWQSALAPAAPASAANARPTRSKIVPVAATRTARPRLHLAAVHRLH